MAVFTAAAADSAPATDAPARALVAGRLRRESAASGDVYGDVYGNVYGVVPDSAARIFSVGKPTVADAAGATGTVTARRTSARAIADAAGATDSAASLITNRAPLGGVHLRLWDKTGTTLLAMLPELESLTVGVEHNDSGAIACDYPLDGAGADAFAGLKAGILGAYEGTRELLVGHFTQDGDDPADQQGTERRLSFAATGTLDLLSWIELYPQGGFNTAPIVQFGDVNGGVSPGSLLLTLLNRGKARGCLDGVTAPNVQATFTATHDSAGQPWPYLVWLQYQAGQSLLDVVKELVERGFVDTRMRRFSWDVYVQDTVLAGDHTDVWVRRARELGSAPRQTDRSTVRTALLMLGEGSVSGEVVDPVAVNDYGRREGNSGQSGVSDGAMLAQIGNAQLRSLKHLKEGITASYDRQAGGPQPFVDYLVGDFVRADWYVDPNSGANLPVRVRTATVTYDQDGARGAELELNDLFLEFDDVLQRRMDALTKGSSSVTTAPPTPIAADTSVPDPPGGVSVTSDVVVGKDGRARAVALVSWPPVVSNTDGTPFDDDGGYRVSWSIDGSAYTADVVTAAGVGIIAIPSLPPGATLVARVAAADYNGHQSTYAYSPPTVLEVDTTGPAEAPTLPQVSAVIGGLEMAWDGLPDGSPVVTWDPDFDHVQAYLSVSDDFASAAPVGAPLVGPGAVTAAGLDYGQTYYAWLVAFDHAGNAGPASDRGAGGGGVAGVPVQVLSPDIGGGAVGPEALAYRDFGNKVPDGSFELQASRDRLAADPAWSTTWSFSSGSAAAGGWALRANAAIGAGAVRSLPLVAGVEAVAGGKLWFTFKAKGIGANGSARLLVVARDSAGAVIATTTLVASASTGAWVDPDVTTPAQAFTYTFPANVATYDVLVSLPAVATLGTWDFDAVQVRDVVQTAVIDQLAVGTAQIALLAVGDAQVGNLTVSALQAGTLTASYVALGNGLLTTTSAGQQSGARVEFDSSGIRAYDATSTSATTGKTIDVKNDGSVMISGQIGAAGLSGGTITGTTLQTSAAAAVARVVIGPGNSVAFWPGTVGGLVETGGAAAGITAASYVNATGTNSIAGITIASPAASGYQAYVEVQPWQLGRNPTVHIVGAHSSSNDWTEANLDHANFFIRKVTNNVVTTSIGNSDGGTDLDLFSDNHITLTCTNNVTVSAGNMVVNNAGLRMTATATGDTAILSAAAPVVAQQSAFCNMRDDNGQAHTWILAPATGAAWGTVFFKLAVGGAGQNDPLVDRSDIHAGTVYSNGSAVTSSRALKKGVRYLDEVRRSSPLDKVRPVEFSWRAGALGGSTDHASRHSGFLAEELAEVPELAHLVRESFGVPHYDPSGLLAEAVHELRMLRARVAALEGRQGG